MSEEKFQKLRGTIVASFILSILLLTFIAVAWIWIPLMSLEFLRSIFPYISEEILKLLTMLFLTGLITGLLLASTIIWITSEQIDREGGDKAS